MKKYSLSQLAQILMPSLIVVVGLLCQSLYGQTDFPRPETGGQAPDFQLKFVDGSEDRSLHEATRPTVLFFGSYS